MPVYAPAPTKVQSLVTRTPRVAVLILALQILFEDDAPNLQSVVLTPKSGFLLPVRRVEVRVVLYFALPADARIERLGRLVLAIRRMRVEQVSALVRERQAALVVAEVHRFDEALVAQVFERVMVDIQVLLGYDAKGAERGQRAAVLAVQLVDTVADRDQLPLLPARQVESRIRLSRGSSSRSRSSNVRVRPRARHGRARHLADRT